MIGWVFRKVEYVLLYLRFKIISSLDLLAVFTIGNCGKQRLSQ